jgi:hypothetical protein
LATVIIFLYTDYVMTAGVVSCAGYAMTADTSVYNRRKVWVKRFADACYKDEKGVAKGVTCPKNKEVTSPVKVKLRQS